jgi:transposase
MQDSTFVGLDVHKRVDDRRVINGIFYVLRTGSP